MRLFVVESLLFLRVMLLIVIIIKLKIVSEQNTIYMFPQSYAFYGKNEKEFDYSKIILESLINIGYTKQKVWADLPPEEMTQYERFESSGLADPIGIFRRLPFGRLYFAGSMASQGAALGAMGHLGRCRFGLFDGD